MTHKPKAQDLPKLPRNVLMILAGIFGLYMLGSGIYGIIFEKSAEEALAENPNSVALQTLVELPAPSGAKVPSYDRKQFGDGWADLDDDGCNTRNEILARDLQNVKTKPNGCVVDTGVLNDPYTGADIQFRHGKDTSAEVQIDHVVALANAWASGAWEWDILEREDFANDPLNLLAVDGAANQEKLAKSADEWLPPKADAECDYVARQIAVKSKWELSVTDAERQAMAEVLQSCPNVDLPVR